MTRRKDRRLTIPARFRSEIRSRSYFSDELFSPVVLVPGAEEKILLLGMKDFRSVMQGGWASCVQWDQSLEKILCHSKPNPANPWFSTDRISIKAVEAEKVFRQEFALLKGTRSRKGKEAERIFAEILESMGVSVQLNVRVLGAEIDLLLMQTDDNESPSFCIIELKYRQGRVQINQVMRLFGLQESLKRYVEVKNAVLVTSAGLTEPAAQFAKSFSLSTVEFQKLFEWVERNWLIGARRVTPVFRMCNIDSRGSIPLPKPTELYFSGESEIIVQGELSCLELWGGERWFSLQPHLLASEETDEKTDSELMHILF